MHKGDRWNESQVREDPRTRRRVRALTSEGDINYKSPYHTRTTFTEDGKYLVTSTYRDGASSLLRADAATGELVCLTEPLRSDELSITPGTVAPVSGWHYYWERNCLKGVNVYSLEERVIIEDVGREWSGALLSVDPGETLLATPITTTHPNLLAGRPAGGHKAYEEAFPGGEGLETKILEVSLDTGEVTEIFSEAGVKCAHLEYSPVDSDLIYLDRDLSPMWWAGGDESRTARCHILRRSTAKLTPLTPRAEAKFQIHAVWSWDGEFILYHGPSVLIQGPCPWYIGVVRPNGEIFREWIFEGGRHYGHVAAAPDRPAIILDGNTTEDELQWLYYDSEEPRFEPIGVHATEWGSLPGQMSHPHPSTDSAGRYVAWNVAAGGRSDVCVTEI